MIHDFAIEPELAASWHERRVAYPFLCQMGLGHPRVPCVFPSAAWKQLVMNAFQANHLDPASPHAHRARQNIQILLRHLEEISTRRNGKLADGETWLNAATREHKKFPFGGIVVCTSAASTPHIVAADRLAEQDHPAWTPPAPPVVRQPKELAKALGPVLRSAAQLRFVDPYFDADDSTFFEPMKEYLLAAQARRSIGDLRLQIHFSVTYENIQQASRVQNRALTEGDVAKSRLAACYSRIQPILRPGVTVQAFAWGEHPRGPKLHNRYVLTEVGGIAVQTGLDRSQRETGQTDDLTILSKEQYVARWSEYCAKGTVYRLISDFSFTCVLSASG